MVEVCNNGCRDVCEEGECEIKVELGKRVPMRTMASLVIEILGAEEVEVVNQPKGKVLNAFLEIAKWLGIEVKSGRAP